jgi:hypothetical protein
MKMTRMFLVLALAFGCGAPDYTNTRTPPPNAFDEMRREMLKLQAELNSIVESDYATCSVSLSQAAQNICKIAQAATIEARTEMAGALSDLATQLEAKIYDTQVDVGAMAGMWTKIYGVDFPETSGAATPTEADCTAFNSNASIMECLKVQGSAIETLQAAVDALTGTISGAAIQVAIGEENIIAGPVYEYILRMGDGGRVNAYADGLQGALALGNNPLTASSGTPTITVSSTAHGLTVGNFVRVSNCQSGKGFTAFHLNAQFEVATVPDVNSFTVTTTANATSNGTFGGSSCLVQRYTGNGFTSIWVAADGSDTAVRKTTSGSRSYSFAICKTTGNVGKVCYDQTNRSATFGTISAIPTWDAACTTDGNILCK